MLRGVVCPLAHFTLMSRFRITYHVDSGHRHRREIPDTAVPLGASVQTALRRKPTIPP